MFLIYCNAFIVVSLSHCWFIALLLLLLVHHVASVVIGCHILFFSFCWFITLFFVVIGAFIMNLLCCFYYC